MINILLGGPGGGKSYEACAFHVLPAILRGRKVITNLPLNIEAFEALEPGCSALIEIRIKTLALPPVEDDRDNGDVRGWFLKSRQAKFVDRPFANVEDYVSDWRHEDGTGPLFVVDECHFALPKFGTSKAVEEWYSMHRHYNVDVLLITQSSGKISTAIRDLVQVCYKVRKAIAFGKPDGYIRKVLDGVNGGEVSVSERKYKPAFFKLYRSHTKGLALEEQGASDVSPFIVKFNRFRYAFYVVTVLGVAYAIWGGGSSKPKKLVRGSALAAVVPLPVASAPLVASSGPVALRPLIATSAASVPVLEALDPVDAAELKAKPEPFEGRGIHITGWLRNASKTVYSFAISKDGYNLFSTTQAELEKSGYKFEALGECSGRLTYLKKVRTVLCDAPMFASGRNNDPVVIDSASGRTSRH